VRDAATFPFPAISAVFGPIPLCTFTLERGCELHHILGRGELFGARKGSQERSHFSSPLNCCPILPAIHKGPLRDHRLMRQLFLEKARERVLNAAALGEYTLTDDDRAFLQISSQWSSDNP
jgi:hypothetical protein